MLGINASEASVALLRKSMGTDRPILEQLASHLQAACRFDLGRSIIDGRNVAVEVREKFSVTATVGSAAVLLAAVVSYLINLLIYYVPRATILLRLTVLGIIVPTFFSGTTAALVFGVWFPVVPLASYGTTGTDLRCLLLPAAIASLYPTALMARLLNNKIADGRQANYARAAVALGFSPWQVFHKALLRPSLVSWLAVLINQVSLIFVASFVLEVIFTIPGTGPLLVRSIQQKDFPMLQGILIFNAAFFITLSLLSDALFHLIDVRTAQHA